ncbi:SAM-dependent methyltransferase [Pseudonocardia sp. HH130630-07]|uniref:SAM-dependent methyltransferase n=1 Tax=Pseudonocardia sp. HH130630-07 TaxID=1690815 RepID=UPI000839C91E|nr:SAM-dependent methyltransferase [Pseudonocardia sp. HH130630-07]
MRERNDISDPEAIDLNQPNAARAYDFLLGGSHNFESDRQLARTVRDAYPGAVSLAQANRVFLRHAVRHCVRDLAITQLLDLGSGLPTVGNVHETAWTHNPAARVAYVDIEPVAVTYSRHLLGDTDQVTVTQADLRHPRAVLTSPGVADLLDLTQPVAVLLIGVLHFVSDTDQPAQILRAYRDALAPGSVLVLAQSSTDYPDHPQLAAEIAAANSHYASTRTPGTMRNRAEIHALLTGWDLEPPGLIDVAQWAPGQHHADPLGGYGAITRPLTRPATAPQTRPRAAGLTE